MANNSKPGKRLNILDLFSGCGGLSTGLSLSGGYDIVAACEHWKPAADTFRLNHPGTILIEGDITKEKTKVAICKPFINRKCDVVVGGVPCQAYSISGRRDSEDPRFFLYEDYLDIVGRLNPTLAVIENVTGILSVRHSDGSSVISRLSKGLSDLGYSVGHRTVNSADYGVPQVRERILIFGWKQGSLPRLKMTHDQHGRSRLPPWVTVRESIGDLSDLPQDSQWSHIFPKHSTEFVEKIKATPNGGRVLGFSEAFARLRPDNPSTTVMANGSVFTHYSKDRCVSPREMARLQSFPDEFKFCGSKCDVIKQIGNAVPPILGKAIGLAILESLGVKSKVVTAITPKSKVVRDGESGLPIHPHALLFPSIPQTELDALAADIKKNGLVDAIVLHEGQVLDGVHRLRACGLAKIKPRFIKWDGEGGSPIQFVLSKNWSRRHLTASQKAAIALTMEEVLAKQIVRGRPQKGRNRATIFGKASNIAASFAGVSARYIQEAKFIAGISPDLIEDVRAGRMTIPDAKRAALLLSELEEDGGSAGSQSTHRIELDIQGTRLRSLMMTEDDASRIAKVLSKRLGGVTGTSISVMSGNGTTMMPI